MNKWIYCDNDNEEYWFCPEEFDTKEEAIQSGGDSQNKELVQPNPLGKTK